MVLKDRGLYRTKFNTENLIKYRGEYPSINCLNSSMFNFIVKTLLNVRSTITTSATHELFFLHRHPLSSLTLKSISNSTNQNSFAVSYLINSFGFSPEKAESVSKCFRFETPDKPDSVLAFFKNHGFTDTQISCLIKRCPQLLLCNPQKNLLPKLEFFSSIGISSTDLAKLVTVSPRILKSSLENQIIPSFNIVKTLLKSEEKSVDAIKRSILLFGYDLQNRVLPNIEILRESGVLESSVVYLLTYNPRVLMTDTDCFKKIVEEVKAMGFDPLKMKFVVAVQALRSMSKITWEKKVELYKKWGWSDDEIFMAFEKYPWCMLASEDKITRALDFFVNKLGWESSVLARKPILISLSLEKRIVPRCSVYQVLLVKGLIRKDWSLAAFLEYPEKKLLNKIIKWKKEVPELLKLYQEKVGSLKSD